VLVLRIRFERQNRQQSQTRIARVARIAQPVLSQIETGRLIPTPAQLVRLAAVFDVEPSELLKNVAEPGPSL
jgi:transcriptional regulator with XRE-family HTH domain